MGKHWSPAYVGVGSNLDDPAAQVRTALLALGGLERTRLVRASALYRNPPMGPQDQPDFVNAVAGLVTQLDPLALLDGLIAIEIGQGRTRRSGDRWGPRRIDLDLLAMGGRVVDSDRLRLPHPGISERNFVLFPLLEIAPDLQIPGQGRVRDLARGADATTLESIGPA